MVAVEEGEGDVQQHQMGVEGGELRQDVVEPLRAADGVAPALQMAADDPGDGRVVLHDENAVHEPLLSPRGQFSSRDSSWEMISCWRS